MSKRYKTQEAVKLILYPSLAVALGDDKQAVILAQVYYWLSAYSRNPDKNRKHYRDSHWWTYGSVAEWTATQFPHLSEKTVGRKFQSLRKSGYIVKAQKNYNARQFNDQTDVSWYRIDFKKLHEDIPLTRDIFPDVDQIKPKVLYDSDTSTDNLSQGYGQSVTRGMGQNGVTSTDNLSQGYGQSVTTNTLDYPYTSPNTILPNITLSDSDNDLLRRISDIVNTEDSEQMKDKGKVVDFFARYLEEYHSSRNTEHGSVSDRTLRTAVQNVIDSKAYEHTEIIQGYFATEYRQGCDYRIGHFSNKKILQKRLEAVSKPEQTEQKDSGTWRDSLRYLQRNDIDDLMRYYVPARKEGLDLRKLSDTEYADYIWDDTHDVRLDYSEDREFIGQCLDELLQLIDKPKTETRISEEPHGNYETHILSEYADDEWLDDGPEEQLPFE